MAYTALYRAFRPQTFSELVGQEHITTTLKNQIIIGRVGHAYLFSGGRGTGKTSSAKILARAINCLNPKDGEPCNECEICKGILAGAITDVVEMDAASNNSVEDIRSIREEVNFLPTVCKYRVYIIDEVHMLSTGAFNALLKTLEEPPEHVKFILATTEPQKLPATILSRCQRFDFKRLSNTDIIKRLEIICKQSKIEITTEGLNIIANLSEGAMRDAISILERCIQDGESKISEEKIKDLTGIPKTIYIQNQVKAILEHDIEKALKNVDAIINEGKDLSVFLWEIIKYLKDIMLLKTGCDLALYSAEEIKQMEELAKLTTKDELLKKIIDLSELDTKMKWSNQKTIVFQVGIISACKEDNTKIEEIEKRINKIESILSSGTITQNIQSSNKSKVPEIKQENKSIPNQKIQIKPETKKVNAMPTKEGVPYWSDIIKELHDTGKIMLYSNLINSKAIEINDMELGIEFPNGLTSFGKAVLERPDNKQALTQIISLKAGKEMQIKLLENKANTQNEIPKTNSIDNISKELEIPINILEEE